MSVAQPGSVNNYRAAPEAACAQGLLQSVLIILRQWSSDATASGPSANGLNTALWKKADYSVVSIVQELFSQGAQLRNWVGVTAVKVGAPAAILEIFLEPGSDINSKDSQGNAVIRWILTQLRIYLKAMLF